MTFVHYNSFPLKSKERIYEKSLEKLAIFFSLW